jgi:hypothetical protein
MKRRREDLSTPVARWRRRRVDRHTTPHHTTPHHYTYLMMSLTLLSDAAMLLRSLSSLATDESCSSACSFLEDWNNSMLSLLRATAVWGGGAEEEEEEAAEHRGEESARCVIINTAAPNTKQARRHEAGKQTSSQQAVSE